MNWDEGQIDTFFAPAERTSTDDLQAEIGVVRRSTVLEALLETVSGLLAILDHNRQIVAFNDAFFRSLGIENADSLLGLRPGEAVACQFANTGPGGCGTSKSCSTCGAAIAIVTSQANGTPVERDCHITTVSKNDHPLDVSLRVRAHPITIENEVFILLFLQDITAELKRAALERTFFHDINNILGGLMGASWLLLQDKDDESLHDIIYQSVKRLKKEIEVQRQLIHSDMKSCAPELSATTVEEVLEETQRVFLSHPCADGKQLLIQRPASPGETLITDLSLVLRVLSNMIINALEASTPSTPVTLHTTSSDNHIRFIVHNAQWIPDRYTQRIFQRNFTTKQGTGRGTGTFSMKLLGEQLLKGTIAFKTSPTNGTSFSLTLPRTPSESEGRS